MFTALWRSRIVWFLIAWIVLANLLPFGTVVGGVVNGVKNAAITGTLQKIPGAQGLGDLAGNIGKKAGELASSVKNPDLKPGDIVPTSSGNVLVCGTGNNPSQVVYVPSGGFTFLGKNILAKTLVGIVVDAPPQPTATPTKK
jgi:hypothetical protein